MPPAGFDPTLNAYWTLLNLGVTGVVVVLILIGKLRTEREVVREREISDDRGAENKVLVGELKETSVALNRLADGVEARNRIEVTMRGRRQ